MHDVVYNKPYDKCPYMIGLKHFKKTQNRKRWIDFGANSALVGYIYTECGILEKNSEGSKIVTE